MKLEITEDFKKSRNNLKSIEKKNLEEIISSNNYYGKTNSKKSFTY